MRNTVRRAYVVYALIFAFFIGLGFLAYSYVVHGQTWVTNRVNGHLYTNRQLTSAGTVYDRSGKILVRSKDGKRVFNSDYTTRKATLHVVGDTQGYIATGVQSIYRSYLIGYDLINGVYKTVKDGTGNDMTLTIDAGLCVTAYNALGSHNGTIAVYNYKTGDVICMVSKPAYDPHNIPSDINSDTSGKYDGIYLNRCLSGLFTPGSTFKTIVAVSAIENLPDISKRTFTCTGKLKTKDGDIICNSKHGDISFKKAYGRSCNSVFAEIALELGEKKLTATAQELGFNKSLQACGVNLKAGVFNMKNADQYTLGWSGIGQGTVLANPCNMMMIAGAIANGGKAVTPQIVKSAGSKLTKAIDNIKGSSQITIDAKTAQYMQELMRYTVKNVYGENYFPGLKMCGKTGTAEVDGKKPHSWFFGYSLKEDTPYAIVVMVENGGSSRTVAIPAASKVMRAVKAAVVG